MLRQSRVSRQGGPHFRQSYEGLDPQPQAVRAELRLTSLADLIRLVSTAVPVTLAFKVERAVTGMAGWLGVALGA